ncbi:MAG: CHASE2 domain-containing protein [Symploca sp. SIO2B6]|nr:CHASE2 domain-containing protein [Symploca sp. SIO2B6]
MRSKFTEVIRGWKSVLITAPVMAGLVIGVKLTGTFQLLEWAAYDQFFRLRPQEPIDERLLIVSVDDSDINYVGQWPIPDATLAQLITNLKQHQPVAIGLDFYRDLPVEPGHKLWVEVMKSTPNLVGVEKAVGKQVAPPSILREKQQVGLTDLLVDADGKIRRSLLSHYTPDGQMRYCLGVHLALNYLKERGITLELVDSNQKNYRLGRTIFTPFTGNDGGYVRTNSGGYQILLNYRGQQDSFPTVSLRQVLENQVDPELIGNRLVLIGSTAESLNDLFYTPYSSPFTNTPQPAPGVVIHANAASQILSAAIDGRSPIRVWNELGECLWILLWSSIGATVHWGLLEIDRQRQRITARWIVISIYICLGGGVLFTVSYAAFLAGWWIPLIPPLVALSGSAILITAEQIRKLQQQRLELAIQKFKLKQEKIQAEAASAAKSQFLAKMSHELRTPLNAILGFTQIMSHSSELSTEHQEYLGIISRSGEHLLQLINDILDLSKIEAGMMSLNESNFDLYSLLDGLEQMFRIEAFNKNLKLVFEINPNVPQYLKADAKKLRVCLINLLSNAIKFTQAGSVTLRVDLELLRQVIGKPDKQREQMDNKLSTASVAHNLSSTSPPQLQLRRLLFEVEDTGSGIAQTEVDSLFDDFVQTKTGKQADQGTGLGLSITRSFVQLMGGEITLNSVVGKGTVFNFFIQLEPLNSSATIHSFPPQYQDVSPSKLDLKKSNYTYQQSNSFLLEGLAKMPYSWVEKLHHSTLRLDEQVILELIEQIPEEEAMLAAALRDLLSNFRLDLLHQFTQSVLDKSGNSSDS